MQEILKADIFFFVTTIVVVLVGICLIIFLIYALQIIADVKFISRKVKQESEEFIQDAKEMREAIKEKGTSLVGILSLIFGQKKTKSRKK